MPILGVICKLYSPISIGEASVSITRLATLRDVLIAVASVSPMLLKM